MLNSFLFLPNLGWKKIIGNPSNTIIAIDINNNKAKQFGKCSCKKTYIKAINNKLKQSGGSYDGYCHDLISQCSDSYAAC